MDVGLSRLDDEDYPAVAMGQAAELLDVQPAFLRSLDAAGVVSLNLDDAIRITELEQQLATPEDRP